MKITLVTVTLLAAASAQWQTWGGLNRWNNVGLGWNGLALPAAQVVAPLSTSSQYHAQDELGQASFGYSHPGQSSATFQDAWGNQVGNYQYVNPEGKLVRVDFVADALGFRVASNALPEGPAVPVVPKVALPVGPSPVEDTPEVKQARAEHLAAVAEVRSRSRRSLQLTSPWTRTVATPWAQGLATPLAAPWAQSVATPLAAPWAQTVATPWAQSVATPLAAPWAQTVATPWAVPTSSASQYHAQDEFGQARFGYSHPGANHHVARDAAGNQVGSYSYVDAEGKVIVTSYVADALGFRVVSNGLPVAPSAVQTPALVGPAPVQDSAEVAAAKAQHFAAHAAARVASTPVVVVVGPAPVQDTPEVAAAKAEHFAAHAAARAGLV